MREPPTILGWFCIFAIGSLVVVVLKELFA